MNNIIPNFFIWTKIGSEAGQSLTDILLRKELERKNNNGIFFWGIGNALGSRILDFINQEKSPKVLFSEIKTKPKLIDINPQITVMWTKYRDNLGNIKDIPENILVTSRENNRKHYALVCHKDNFEKENWEPIKINLLKNFGSSNLNLGYSQITAVVEKKMELYDKSSEYSVLFSADLISPYYVELINPIEISNNYYEKLT